MDGALRHLPWNRNICIQLAALFSLSLMLVSPLDNKPWKSRPLISISPRRCSQEHLEEAQARLLTSRINQRDLLRVPFRSCDRITIIFVYTRAYARPTRHYVSAEKLKGQGMKNARTKYHARPLIYAPRGRAFLQSDRRCYGEKNRPDHNGADSAVGVEWVL